MCHSFTGNHDSLADVKFSPVSAMHCCNLTVLTARYSTPLGEQMIAISLSVSLYVCLSVCEHISGTAVPIFKKFVVQIPCGRGSVMAQSSFSGVAIRCNWFLSMTSHLAIVGCMAMHGRQAMQDGRAVKWGQCEESEMWTEWSGMRVERCWHALMVISLVACMSSSVLWYCWWVSTSGWDGYPPAATTRVSNETFGWFSLMSLSAVLAS